MRIEILDKKYGKEALEMAEVFYNSAAVLSPVPQNILVHNIEQALDENSNLDGYIFTEDGKAVGMGYVSQYYETEVGGICVIILDLYISDEYRNRGFATKFFEFVFEKYSYAKRFRLELEKDNLKAEALYKKLGFKKLEYMQMIKNKK